MKVAYQGEPGAYSEQAALKYFSTDGLSSSDLTNDEAAVSKTTFLPCHSFPAVFDALHSGRADRAAMPIENSVAGTIHNNLDLLLKHPDLTILGELDFHVKHCLMVLPGSRLQDVNVVKSHPVALAQCKNFLASRFLTSEIAFDTAGSAKRIRKEELKDCAAIASRRAAEIYNLTILSEGIQDDETNYTRFLILGRGKVPYHVGGEFKTSLAFSLKNGPGSLCRALSVFAITQIDLTKIESRHVRCLKKVLKESGEDIDVSAMARWGYVFYCDIARHMDETSVTSALNHLQEITEFYRVLGSYPAHDLDSESKQTSSTQ